MQKLHINLGENSYDIIIGKNYKKNFYKYIKKCFKGSKIFIITDENVNKFYKDKYVEMFKEIEFDVYAINPGEISKNINIVSKIYSEMIKSEIKRNDLILAFGGGVVGDIAGFVAATYLRGIDFIQIPTTTLSQVDSSIGGKVGIDLPEGKNLVGAFYQPKLVLIDTEFLLTLTDKYFYDGFAEIVKYGCIYDKKFFKEIENILNNFLKMNKNISIEDYSKNLRKHLMNHINYLIFRSCEIKKEIVEKDEKENSIRMILNFGHTIGHAIEKYTNYKGYSHGEAISTGIIDIMKIGEKKGITKKGESLVVEKILKNLTLPTNIKYDIEDIKKIIKMDKKSVFDGINFIFLKEIGKVEIIKMKIDEIY